MRLLNSCAINGAFASVEQNRHKHLEDMSTDEALDCGRYQHQDCLWGAIAALNGLAVLPNDMRSAQSKRVVKRLANALLDAKVDHA
jgi:hypothetical protein